MARTPDSPPLVLVEAESFDTLGGWVIDQQFMDVMGSPFLLAHGLGRPVADAETTVEFPAVGTYRVWVRTRDWVAPWNAPGAPGRFQLLIAGRPLLATFGLKGADWHWVNGGLVKIRRKRTRIALHDLTGFEGRCDAILFAGDRDFDPPVHPKAVARFRRIAGGLPEEPEEAGSFDLVVAGGGIAGMCAAVSAARRGLRVALVHDRPVLGGNNSSEVRVWLGGETRLPPYPNVGSLVAEFEPKRRAHHGPDNTAAIYEDTKRIDMLRREGVELLLAHRVIDAEVDGGLIRSVVAEDIRSARRLRLRARLFADCTGDASLGALAGADRQTKRTGHMGRCNLWHAKDTGKPSPFPRCPWALDLTDKPFPGRDRARGAAAAEALRSLGVWFWESGFDHDPIHDGETIRDWNFRAMYGAWDALKNVDRVCRNYQLRWAAYVSGMRESRRLTGDVVLNVRDLRTSRRFPDAAVPCTWSIDVHYPDPRYVDGFEGDAFISYADFEQYPRPYWLPYRCLYSRNVRNLFMAGRNISVTHLALGTVRVMRTTGMMGEIVGMAASLCAEHDTTPRGVYREHLKKLRDLMRRGAGGPKRGRRKR